MKVSEKGIIFFTIALVMGILLSSYFGLFISLTLLLSLVLGCFLFGFAILGNPRDSFFLVLIIALGGVLGLTLNLSSKEMSDFKLRTIVNRQVEIIGNIIEEPTISKGKYRIVVKVKELLPTNKVDSNQFEGEKFLLSVPQRSHDEFKYGEDIKVRGSFELAKPRTNPGGFDYRQYLARQGIGVTMNLWSTKEINKVGYSPNNYIVAFALKGKNWGDRLIRDSLGKDYYPLVQGLIFGDTGEIPEEVNDNFAKLGIIHILSVSGYHMVLIMGIIIFFVSLLPLSRLSKFIVVIFGLSIYATMVGWSPPVTRSFIMGLGGLLGQLYQGKYEGRINWANVLAVTMLAILCYRPQYLFDLGFQFSFTATWGIIYLTPVISKILDKMKVPQQIQLITAGTLGAQIATIPIVAYYFNYVSILSLAANLFTVLLVEIIIILGLISLSLGILFYKLAYMINFSTGIFCWLLLFISRVLIKIPFAIIYLRQPSLISITAFYLVLFLVIWVYHKGYEFRLIKYKILQETFDFSKKRLTQKGRVYSSSIIALSILIFTIAYYSNNHNLSVTYIDVGQGDSILISTPKGEHILIDTGGLPSNPDYDIGGKVVASTLLKLGVNKLDLLIITHDHFDHYGGVKGLSDIIKIKKVLIAMKTGEEQYNKLLEFLKNKGIPIISGIRGQGIEAEDKLRMDILNPPAEPIKGTDSDSNNNSLVLKLTYGSTIFYFTGDIQGEIVGQWDKIDPNSLKELGFTKIWKVPHHGSRFSIVGNFYKRLNPNLAVISVGKNTFGHPHREILEELKKIHCTILRTDQLGAITIESDGEKVKGSWIRKGE